MEGNVEREIYRNALKLIYDRLMYEGIEGKDITEIAIFCQSTLDTTDNPQRLALGK